MKISCKLYSIFFIFLSSNNPLLSKLSCQYNLTSPVLKSRAQISSEQIEDLLKIYDIAVSDTEYSATPSDALPQIVPGTSGLTQTESYLSIPRLRAFSILFNKEQLTRYPKLIQRIINQERKYNKNYDVFYHGQQRDFALFYDVVREIQNWLDKQTTADFEYIRLPANQTMQLSEFLKREYIDDHDKETAGHLLSVNLSLFGNSLDHGENTFRYFTHNLSVNSPEDLLENVFDQLKLNKKYIKNILDLNAYLESSTGNLLQIFIPRNKVNEYVYLSTMRGKPLTRPNAMKKAGLPAGPLSITKADGTTVTYNLETIDPATYLDIYKNHPEAIDPIVMDMIQARIHLTRDFMLNPASGVKIFRYTTVQPEKLLEYQQKLRTIIKQVMEDYKQRNTCSIDSEPFLSKISSYLWTILV